MVTRVLGHLSWGLWAPLQGLTTWVSALHPQSMLEQILIHQPKDPFQFIIEHLQRNNDLGEHRAPSLRLPTPSSCGPLCPPVSEEGSKQEGGGLDHWGWW